MSEQVNRNVVQENQPASKRAEETRKKRRRRTEASYDGWSRLSVNEALLDREAFTYRWVNDSTGRIERFTVHDDWDKVTDPGIKEENNNEGSPVRQLVGSKEDGTALYAYLLKKPIELHREDKAARQRKIDDLESSILDGQHSGGDTLSADSKHGYIPGQNSIETTGNAAEYKP